MTRSLADLREEMRAVARGEPRPDREAAEQAARRRFEERAARLPGHKIGAWESLSPLMREELVQRELTTPTTAAGVARSRLR